MQGHRDRSRSPISTVPVDSGADERAPLQAASLDSLDRSCRARAAAAVVARGDHADRPAPGDLQALALPGVGVLACRDGRGRARLAAHRHPPGPDRPGGRARDPDRREPRHPEQPRPQPGQPAPGAALGRLPLLHGSELLRRARLPRALHPDGDRGPAGAAQARRSGRQAHPKPADLQAGEGQGLQDPGPAAVLDRGALGGVQDRRHLVHDAQQADLLGQRHRGSGLQPVTRLARRRWHLDPAARHQGAVAADPADPARSAPAARRLRPQRAGLRLDPIPACPVRLRLLVRQRRPGRRPGLDLRLVRGGLGRSRRVAARLAPARGPARGLRDDGAGVPGAAVPRAPGDGAVAPGAPPQGRPGTAPVRRGRNRRGGRSVRGWLGGDGSRRRVLGDVPGERRPPQRAARLRQQAHRPQARPRARPRRWPEEEAREATPEEEHRAQRRSPARPAAPRADVLPAGPAPQQPARPAPARPAVDVLPDRGVSLLRVDLGAAAAAGRRPGWARGEGGRPGAGPGAAGAPPAVRHGAVRLLRAVLRDVGQGARGHPPVHVHERDPGGLAAAPAGAGRPHRLRRRVSVG